MSIGPVLVHGLKSEVGGLCRAAMNRTFNNLHYNILASPLVMSIFVNMYLYLVLPSFHLFPFWWQAALVLECVTEKAEEPDITVVIHLAAESGNDIKFGRNKK